MDGEHDGIARARAGTERRRRILTRSVMVGVVVGVVACVALNRIYWGNTVRWGERPLGVDIVATLLFFPLVFTLNLAYTDRPLHGVPLLLLEGLCLLLTVLEALGVGLLLARRRH